LFPTIKSALKGRRFEEIENSKTNIIKELLALNVNEFKRSQGDYFEEYWKICSILKVLFLK
jgi:hypothetical protein